MIGIFRRFGLAALAALTLAACLAAAPKSAPPAAPKPAAATPAARIDESFLADHGLRYSLEVRKEPRPLRLHHLQVDLANPRIELAAALAKDPDGDGPATAALEPPLSLAQRAGAIALVNSNPWRAVPDANGKRSVDWHTGLPVEINGLTVTKGVKRSPPLDHYCGFWMDEGARWHVGNPPAGAKVREAVGGFVPLMQDGKIVPPAGGAIHPRTAAGCDATGRWMHLLVVDGRQPGFSEGMSLGELAAAMRDFGCHEAVNLDGGGSSVMILADKAGARRFVNDPSNKKDGVSITRPIPAGLIIRAREKIGEKPKPSG